MNASNLWGKTYRTEQIGNGVIAFIILASWVVGILTGYFSIAAHCTQHRDVSWLFVSLPAALVSVSCLGAVACSLLFKKTPKRLGSWFFILTSLFVSISVVLGMALTTTDFQCAVGDDVNNAVKKILQVMN